MPEREREKPGGPRDPGSCPATPAGGSGWVRTVGVLPSITAGVETTSFPRGAAWVQGLSGKPAQEKAFRPTCALPFGDVRVSVGHRTDPESEAAFLSAQQMVIVSLVAAWPRSRPSARARRRS